jgi:hypothetical protein
MSPEARRAALGATAFAKELQASQRRPTNLPGAGTPGTRPVKAPVGKKVSSFKPSSVTLRALTAGLGKSGDPTDKKVFDSMLACKMLTPRGIGYLRQKIGLALRATPPNRAFADALRFCLRIDRRRRAVQTVCLALRDLDEDRRWILLRPAGTLIDPGDLTGEGCRFEAPPGIDPCAFALVYPNDRARPDGPGVVCNVEPSSVETGPVDGPDVPPVPDTPPDPKNLTSGMSAGTSPVSSIFHTTRHMRVGNGSKQKIKVHVQYETVTDKQKKDWFPQDPDKGKKKLEFDLKPGEVSDLQDGDWQINASRARIWAETEDGKQEWQQFKDKDLALVPEKDDKGQAGYTAPKQQTFNVAFR